MIVIQGAGIAGLTLAALLEKAGQEYCVVERAEVLNTIGTGLLLQPNAQAVLSELGLLREMLQLSTCVESMSLGACHRPAVIRWGNDFALGVHRGDLHSLLLSLIPASKIFLSTSIVDWKEHPLGVEVKLSDHQRLVATHLIGADGLRSSIRHTCYTSQEYRYSGQWCWRTVINAKPFEDRAIELFKGSYRLGAIPIGCQQTYVYWVSSHLEQDPVEQFVPDQTRLCLFGEKGEQLASYLTPDLLWLCHPLCDRAVRWGKKKVILIGDAAHPVTPNLGQGAALGMEDAWCLYRLLTQKQASAEALKRMRHGRVKSVRRLSWWAGKFAHLENPVAVKLRDITLRCVPEQMIAKTQLRFAEGFSQGMYRI
ncbi:FAD-dependent oxidoreductase [Nitrincola alkalisediminis]|uniref:FAD-dependent oxidoreductase n=1 Tax=Nitrincola alkalisediminis TaxID=1366656 RepID=UPI00187456D6|nr:NAD(P)/FAD-dependent oxidoreductase [Nitrincola alkalisediminis]